VVDCVIEIPLPGRTFSSSAVDHDGAPARVALRAFVAGPENRLIATAIERLVRGADTQCHALPTLLAIYGPSGTGKTHLARGLVQSWQARDGDACAEYFTGADFRHALHDAVRSETSSQFRSRLRSRRLLAIDDIDRLPRDDYLQQEIRYTIDSCVDRGDLFVVTSSDATGKLRNLAADVRSRLAGGLELRLAPPDEAARQQIACQVSAALGRPLSAEAARRLATGVVGTAGDVFGALFELNATLSRPIGSDVRAVERYLATRAARRPTVRDILQAVAKYYRVPQKVLKSSTRRQSVVSARAMAVYLARELSGLSHERIGAALGGRDHTTIMHNYHKIAERLAHDPATRDALDELQRILKPIRT
jgi:chromosomal replication initiator protein